MHAHCAPDVVPRSQDVLALAQDADAAGMAGVVLKDHCGSTVGRAYTINRLRTDENGKLHGARFYSSIVLNEPVGGLNAVAVEATLLAGAAVVWMPTYCSRYHLQKYGPGKPLQLPLPDDPDYEGIVTTDDSGKQPNAETRKIVRLVAKHDRVLATGHLSPVECLILADYAKKVGCHRMIVTHASARIPDLMVDDQKIAVSHGAFIEHSLQPTTVRGSEIDLDRMAAQIRAVGIEHIIISSDFGDPANGPVVEAFATKATALMEIGKFTRDEMQTMLVENPTKLLSGHA